MIFDTFESLDREQSKWEKSRPVCSYCKDPIQDERLMVIEGELYHLKCADKLFGDDTEDYIY